MRARSHRRLRRTVGISLSLLLMQGALLYLTVGNCRDAIRGNLVSFLVLAFACLLLGSCVPLYFVGGRLRREVARRAEAESHASLLLDSVGERLRLQGAALEAATHSIIISDRNKRVIWANNSFTRATGYAREEVIGCDPYPLLSGRRDEQLAKSILETINGKKAWHGELVTRRKDGTLYDEDVTITPVLDDRGEITHFIGITMDVTGRKRSEEALVESNAALEEANRQLVEAINRANELAVKADRANAAKSQFLANMSHEIRTPMNAIIGVSHLLRDTKLSSQQDDYLRTLMISAELLLRTIDDVLDFSRIEAGKLEIDRVEFEPKKVITELLAVFAVRAEEQGLQLRTDLAPGIPAWLLGDPLRLSQVLNNLLDNALKFTRHGFVSLSVSVTRRSLKSIELEFAVRDSGIGIRAGDQAQLFDAFTQVDGSITRTYGGTGLGLAVCKRLTALMGGELWCESVPGLGSTFCFRLPLTVVAGDRAAASQRRPAHRGAPFHGQRVLVVEDNEFNQQVAVALLERGGLQVTIAGNGLEALELVRKQEFDLVLMDIQMPVMDGLTAAREIRKLEMPGIKALPILAVSANAMEHDVKESLAAGMNAHITKPFTPDILYGAIALWVGAKDDAPSRARSDAPSLVGRGAPLAAGNGVSPRDGAAEQAAPQQRSLKVDFEKGIRQTGGNRELYRNLLKRFEIEYAAKGEKIRREMDNGNLQQASHLAHSVKGVAGVLAAAPLQSAAQRLEAELKNGTEGMEQSFREFQEELADTIAYLRGEIPSGQG